MNLQTPPWEVYEKAQPWEYMPRPKASMGDWQAEQEELINAIQQIIDDNGYGGTTMEELEDHLIPKYAKKSLRIAVFSNFDTLYHKSSEAGRICPRGTLYVQNIIRKKIG